MTIKVSDLNKEQRAIKRKNGVSASIFYYRVNKMGWSIEKAVTVTPSKRKNKLVTDEEQKNMNKLGISSGLVRDRMDSGWSKENAISTPVKKWYRFIAYKNDVEVASGKDYEVAEALGIKLETFKYYCTPSYKKRVKNPTIEIDKYTIEEFNTLNEI